MENMSSLYMFFRVCKTLPPYGEILNIKISEIDEIFGISKSNQIAYTLFMITREVAYCKRKTCGSPKLIQAQKRFLSQRK